MRPKKFSFLLIVSLALVIPSYIVHAGVLDFDPSKGYSVQQATLDGKAITYRAYENVPYVENPVLAWENNQSVNYEVMNIYIPVEYFEGKSINSYSSKTAPILFVNGVGGYMPAKPVSINQADLRNTRNKTMLLALSRGFVVVSPGARGRTLMNQEGKYIGKGPAGIVDLKAAIRYLRYNDSRMPGDANKVIATGVSAGGALTALLGATGNHPDYESYLKAIGAARAKDDILAAAPYCPITNLDNADAAYEWQFNHVHTAEMGGPLNEEEIRISGLLKVLFPTYLNNLKLKNPEDGSLLTLNENGEGSFKDYVKYWLIKAFQEAMDEGNDLSGYTWLTISGKRVAGINFERCVEEYTIRMKKTPAFDNLTASTFENNLFGSETINSRHFTQFSYAHCKLENPQMAEEAVIKMMNPMYYIDDNKATISKYWRIRHGAKDGHTSFAIPVILATKLVNKGVEVDFKLPWDQDHAGFYDGKELLDWGEKISKK